MDEEEGEISTLYFFNAAKSYKRKKSTLGPFCNFQVYCDKLAIMCHITPPAIAHNQASQAFLAAGSSLVCFGMSGPERRNILFKDLCKTITTKIQKFEPAGSAIASKLLPLRQAVSQDEE